MFRQPEMCSYWKALIKVYSWPIWPPWSLTFCLALCLLSENHSLRNAMADSLLRGNLLVGGVVLERHLQERPVSICRSTGTAGSGTNNVGRHGCGFCLMKMPADGSSAERYEGWL